jgi:hypothetical protein
MDGFYPPVNSLWEVVIGKPARGEGIQNAIVGNSNYVSIGSYTIPAYLKLESGCNRKEVFGPRGVTGEEESSTTAGVLPI